MRGETFHSRSGSDIQVKPAHDQETVPTRLAQTGAAHTASQGCYTMQCYTREGLSDQTSHHAACTGTSTHAGAHVTRTQTRALCAKHIHKHTLHTRLSTLVGIDTCKNPTDGKIAV